MESTSAINPLLVICLPWLACLIGFIMWKMGQIRKEAHQARMALLEKMNVSRTGVFNLCTKLGLKEPMVDHKYNPRYIGRGSTYGLNAIASAQASMLSNHIRRTQAIGRKKRRRRRSAWK